MSCAYFKFLNKFQFDAQYFIKNYSLYLLFFKEE